MKTLACVLFCLLLISCSDSYEPAYIDAPLKVVVVAGQSNCVTKHALVEQLPGYLLQEQESLYYHAECCDTDQLCNAGWTQVSPYMDTYFGPELSLAWHLSKKLKEPIGIIKHARGGSGLANAWMPRSGQVCYDRLMQKIEAARNDKYEFEIIAVCMMQGEKDAKYEDMAYAYADNLDTLITCLQADCENPELKFVAGRVNPPVEMYPFVDVVREAQKNCSHPNYAWVDCDDLSKDDVTHYDTRGIVELGKRMAEEIFSPSSPETASSE